MSIAHLMFTAVMAFMVVAAAWRGRTPERLAALACLGAAALTAFVRNPAVDGIQVWVLLTDALLCAALLGLALGFDRKWLRFAAAFQFAALVLHAGRLVTPDLPQRAYAIGMSLFSYLVLVMVIWGSLTARRKPRG